MEVVDVYLRNPERMAERGVTVTRCDYDYLPKCYCLHFRSASDCLILSASRFITFSEQHFPAGVQQIYLYQKLALKVFIVSPGRFYHSTRKLNMVELDLGFKYIYTLGWVKQHFLCQTSNGSSRYRLLLDIISWLNYNKKCPPPQVQDHQCSQHEGCPL